MTHSSSLGCLQNDGRLLVTSGLESGDNGGRRGDVDSRDGIALLLSVLEAEHQGTKSAVSHMQFVHGRCLQREDIIADDDAGLAGENVLSTHNVGRIRVVKVCLLCSFCAWR
jgi:hypothetical protein